MAVGVEREAEIAAPPAEPIARIYFVYLLHVHYLPRGSATFRIDL